jgi:uncharacterized protein
VRPVDVVGLDLEVMSYAPVVLLREHDAPHRVLPIFVGGHEALAIVLGLRGEPPHRPLTHDLLAALIGCLDARVDHVEVTELREGTLLARLVLQARGGGRSLDSRPSDAIALALRVDAPLFVSEAVLDEAGAIVPDLISQDAVDEDIERFRAFLDDVDPAEFRDAPVMDQATAETDEASASEALGDDETADGSDEDSDGPPDTPDA